MKKVLLLVVSFVLIMNLSAQDNTTEKPTGNSLPEVKINHEMIKRFQDVKTEGDIYSWSQFFTRSGSNDVQEILAAYANCNPGEESMADIRLALEEKAQQRIDTVISPEEYYAFINQVKQEINAKLGSTGSIALK